MSNPRLTMWMNTEIVVLDTSSQAYHTPWFPKGADKAMFMMELISNTIALAPWAFQLRQRRIFRVDSGRSRPGPRE